MIVGDFDLICVGIAGTDDESNSGELLCHGGSTCVALMQFTYHFHIFRFLDFEIVTVYSPFASCVVPIRSRSSCVRGSLENPFTTSCNIAAAT